MEKPAVAKLEDIELLIAAEARIDTALSQLALANLGVIPLRLLGYQLDAGNLTSLLLMAEALGR